MSTDNGAYIWAWPDVPGRLTPNRQYTTELMAHAMLGLSLSFVSKCGIIVSKIDFFSIF